MISSYIFSHITVIVFKYLDTYYEEIYKITY